MLRFQMKIVTWEYVRGWILFCVWRCVNAFFLEKLKTLCREMLGSILAYMKTLLGKVSIYDVGTRRQDFVNYGKSV